MKDVTPVSNIVVNGYVKKLGLQGVQKVYTHVLLS